MDHKSQNMNNNSFLTIYAHRITVKSNLHVKLDFCKKLPFEAITAWQICDILLGFFADIYSSVISSEAFCGTSQWSAVLIGQCSQTL